MEKQAFLYYYSYLYRKNFLSEFIVPRVSQSATIQLHTQYCFHSGIFFFFWLYPMACEISSPARDRVCAASNGESKPLDRRGSPWCITFFSFKYEWLFFNEKYWSWPILFFCLIYNIELNNYGDVKFSLLIILTKKLNPRETKQLFSHLKGH